MECAVTECGGGGGGRRNQGEEWGGREEGTVGGEGDTCEEGVRCEGSMRGWEGEGHRGIHRMEEVKLDLAPVV